MDRKTYIGSSDARDILSGDWEKMYRRKIGLDPDLDLSDVFPVQLGLITEDFHLDWTTRKLNEENANGFKFSKLTKSGDQHFASLTPDTAMTKVLFGSHPDALMRDDLKRVYPIEAKITGRFASPEEAADHYMPQIQHHLMCWGVDRMLFSCIINTSEPQRIWVGHSPEWQDHYIKRADAFWKLVEDKTPPPPAFYDSSMKKPVVPTTISDTVPINGMTKRDMSKSNSFKAMANTFIETKEAVARHEKVKKDLKEMMAETESELYSPDLRLKRNKAGSILFTILRKDD